MHPEVEQDRPGACLQCGMTLERSPAFAEPNKIIYTCPITTLVMLSQLIEVKARSHTGEAIKGLLNFAAKTAHRFRRTEQVKRWLRCVAIASSVLWLRELSKLITRARSAREMPDAFSRMTAECCRRKR
jgi:hypothetical protein